MIIEAIDERTGKTVKIEYAYPRQRVTCPHCGAGMHPVLKVKSPFFRCNDGQKHTHYLCMQLEKTNRVYDPNLIVFEQLFANLFRPVIEREGPVLPPVWEDDPVDEPKDGVPVAKSGEENGGKDDEQVDAGPEEDPDVDEDNEPHEPMILPCRTLSQLWKAGIDKFGPSERIGSCLRSDIFLWFKDFDEYFAHHEDLGKRVLAVRPLWPVNRANAILFTSFSGIQNSNESKPEYKKKYFVLAFQDRKEYNEACKKLFIRNTGNSGASNTSPKYGMVLVAGDWAELDGEKSAVFVKPGENNYGVQSSPFFSKNQIFLIPKQKIKK